MFYEGNNKFLSSPWQGVAVGRFLNWKIIGLCSTWTNKLCVGLKISCLSSNWIYWRIISPSWLLIDSFKRSEINWSIKLLNNKAIKQEFQSCYTHTTILIKATYRLYHDLILEHAWLGSFQEPRIAYNLIALQGKVMSMCNTNLM